MMVIIFLLGLTGAILCAALAWLAFAAQRTAGRLEATRRDIALVQEALRRLGTELQQELEKVREEAQLSQNAPSPQSYAGPVRPALNLSQRSQVLKMHRHGASTKEITSSLGVTRNEVALLIKIQQLVLESGYRL